MNAQIIEKLRIIGQQLTEITDLLQQELPPAPPMAFPDIDNAGMPPMIIDNGWLHFVNAHVIVAPDGTRFTDYTPSAPPSTKFVAHSATGENIEIPY